MPSATPRPVAARGGRAEQICSAGTFSLLLLEDGGELFVEIDGALDRLGPVAEVQALVLRVRVGVRILDADEQRRHAAQLARERLDERNRSAAAHGERARAVALLEHAEGRLEGRMRRVGVPPAGRALGM